MLNIKKGGMVHIKLGHGGNNLVLERTGIYEHHYAWHIILDTCQNEKLELFSNFEIRNMSLRAAK